MKKIIPNLVTIVLFFYINNTLAQEKEIIKEDSTMTSNTIKDVPFRVIEEVPVFPGCGILKTNKEKKKCFNLSMRKHIGKHFNIEMMNCLEKILVKNKETGIEEEECTSGLTPGVKRIYLQFKIDYTGEIINIVARGPHPKLEEEAIRIAKLIPKMEKPALQKGVPVRVGYTLPITFRVE
ncbi:energy transducer TonB [Tenacibaculum amylolyticum]|uniref:energy transducer TonB n=1 Tax=Tenacibaculum amylolyticum TaxID=104269 RepID=UPI0038954001